jgi:AcrR family transcriptional regulator
LRQELITAARQLFASADAESELGIRGVARAARVHPQAFYLHVDNLDACLYEV